VIASLIKNRILLKLNLLIKKLLSLVLKGVFALSVDYSYQNLTLSVGVISPARAVIKGDSIPKPCSVIWRYVGQVKHLFKIFDKLQNDISGIVTQRVRIIAPKFNKIFRI